MPRFNKGTDALIPIKQLKLQGALLCDGSANGRMVQMVIDTGSGLSLVRRSFPVADASPIFGWEGPSALLVSGQKFHIKEGCRLLVDLLGIRSWHIFGLVDIFPFDILLGTDFLCCTPFLIDLKHGLLINPSLEFPPKTSLLFINTILPPLIPPQKNPIACYQGPVTFMDSIANKGESGNSKNATNALTRMHEVESVNPRVEWLTDRSPVVATREDLPFVSEGDGEMTGPVLAFPVVTPEVSELTKGEEIVGKGTTFRSYETEVTCPDEMNDNDLMWVPSDKTLNKLERPDQDPGIDFETLSLNNQLNELEKSRLLALLKEFPEVFPSKGVALGCTNVIEHQIKTSSHAPVNEPLRRFALWQREEINKQIKDMLDKGIISPCTNAEWVANVVLARKKDGTLRFCVDYKNLNERTDNDPYPLPRIDDCLDALKNCSYYTGLDLASGYWQVRMSPESKSKTCFRTPDGIYQFEVMPFGLKCAPSTFCRLMDNVLGDLKFKTLILYLDDIEIFSDTFEEHLVRLRTVLERLKAARLKLKPSKCHFAQRELKFLGHIVSAEGRRPDPDNVRSISEFPRPRNLKETRSFVGAAAHYRKYIKDFGKLAAPLHQLTHKDHPFEWTESQENSFNTLKEKMISTPILAHFDNTQDLVLETDASGEGLGAVLNQTNNAGKTQVLA